MLREPCQSSDIKRSVLERTSSIFCHDIYVFFAIDDVLIIYCNQTYGFNIKLLTLTYSVKLLIILSNKTGE